MPEPRMGRADSKQTKDKLSEVRLDLPTKKRNLQFKSDCLLIIQKKQHREKQRNPESQLNIHNVQDMIQS